MSTFMTKDGASHYYKDWGVGQPVVFSHGWPLNADAWDEQMFYIASHGYRVIAHDRRGHGRSDQTWDGNDMNTYADDLAALIEMLDLHDAVLVGHSTGGGEVTRYIGRHGTSRLVKAVLVDAIPPLMLKTEANPAGQPIEAFDQIRAGVATDRSQYYKDLSAPLEPIDQAPRYHKAFETCSGCGRCRSGSKVPMTASRSSLRPISPKTSSGSTSPL